MCKWWELYGDGCLQEERGRKLKKELTIDRASEKCVEYLREEIFSQRAYLNKENHAFNSLHLAFNKVSEATSALAWVATLLWWWSLFSHQRYSSLSQMKVLSSLNFMICNSNLFSFRLLIYLPAHSDKAEKVLESRPKNAVDVYVHHTIQLLCNASAWG